MKPGIYNIYKPPGPTSHDVVDQIRKLSGISRVGHAGTLDPFAEGVLIVAVGREYTKQLGKFLKQDKTYRATIRLGATSDSGDPTGKISRLSLEKIPAIKEVEKVLKSFVGEIEQVPPAFSAIKIHPVKSGKAGTAKQLFDGVKSVRAYKLARQGIFPKLKPRQVTIYSLKIIKYHWPYLEVETEVSSGTYIRSLAQDIGQTLKTGGYLEKLIRLKVGRFNLKKSLKI